MLEVITGVSLATAAGLNAYIPLLGLGLLSRFTEFVTLPASWTWLENGWSLGIIGVLLLIEVIVDKVPAIDSINNVLQTVVRPASGGMVFTAGSASDTVAVTDPQAFLQSAQLWPFLIGIGIALVPHIIKALVRPVLNILTIGAGAAVMSTLEDAGAVIITLLAVIVPVLAVVAIIGLLAFLIVRLRKAILARREQRTAQGPTPGTSDAVG